MNKYRVLLHCLIPRRIAAYDHHKCFSQTSKLYSFFENDHRGGDYPLIVDVPLKELLREGHKQFFQECKLFWHETKDHFQQDRKYYSHGDTDVFWRFDSEVHLIFYAR